MSAFWNKKNVLVTGGTGFIGSFTVEQLINMGANVTVTASHNQSIHRWLTPVADQITVKVGDLEDPKIAREALEGTDVLIHMAAHVGGIEYNIKHPGSIFKKNMQVFLNVLEAARLEHVDRTLVTSSACVYPRHCSIPTPEAEGFLERPEPTNEGYGWAKRMQEFLSEAYVKEYGMNITIARPYNAYGPRDNFNPQSSHVIAALIKKVADGNNPLIVWGDGSASRSFLYVEDFARGILEVAEKSPQVSAINIGAQEETTIKALAHLIVDISGKNIQLEFDSKQPAGQPRRACDTQLAQKLIGYQTQVSLQEGLRRTYEWYVNNCQNGAI